MLSPNPSCTTRVRLHTARPRRYSPASRLAWFSARPAGTRNAGDHTICRMLSPNPSCTTRVRLHTARLRAATRQPVAVRGPSTAPPAPEMQAITRSAGCFRRIPPAQREFACIPHGSGPPPAGLAPRLVLGTPHRRRMKCRRSHDLQDAFAESLLHNASSPAYRAPVPHARAAHTHREQTTTAPGARSDQPPMPFHDDDPSDSCWRFHTGRSRLIASMISRHTAKASARCAEATAITTAASPTAN